MKAATVKSIARECGFELVGIAPTDPGDDFDRYRHWIEQGYAGAMGYLTGRRAEIRGDLEQLLPGAKSVICVGKLYNLPSAPTPGGHGTVSKYAAGPDYHDTLRSALKEMAQRLQMLEACDVKVCVDTAPLLERTFARLAGLGWIGKNTCLINQESGSWFFLGELITTLELETDSPPPDRCGTCSRCIDACPTGAFVKANGPSEAWWALDARRCISYLTIELRGPIPEEHRSAIGSHLFGCDVCQDVCPWNSRAPLISDVSPQLRPSLKESANLSEGDFHLNFRATALLRAKYSGFLRNVAVAMGNSGLSQFRAPLEQLASHDDPIVAEHARWALGRLDPMGVACPDSNG